MKFGIRKLELWGYQMAKKSTNKQMTIDATWTDDEVRALEQLRHPLKTGANVVTRAGLEWTVKIPVSQETTEIPVSQETSDKSELTLFRSWCRHCWSLCVVSVMSARSTSLSYYHRTHIPYSWTKHSQTHSSTPTDWVQFMLCRDTSVSTLFYYDDKLLVVAFCQHYVCGSVTNA